MKYRIAFFAGIPAAVFAVGLLNSTAAHAQGGGRGGFGGGAVAVVPTCESGRPAVNLGFAYYMSSSARAVGPVGSGSSGVSTAGAAVSAGGASAGRMAGAIVRDVPFNDEPLIMGVDDNGPAANRVQDGDRIARVNGFPVTTIEGTQALRSAQPGKSLVLTIRRGDILIPASIIPTGWRCPMTRDAAIGAVTVTGRAIEGVPAPTVVNGTQATTSFSGTLARTPSNAGWLGLGFDCTSCGQRVTPNGRVWYFSEPPTIYNVDTGSPAYNAGIRRGDVLLEIDGKDIRQPAAGARLGLVKPGEKLRLAYKRDTRKYQTTLSVAASPVFQRNAVALRSAGNLLKSTQELRLSVNESRVKALMQEIDRSKTIEQRNISELENLLRQKSGTDVSRQQQTLGALSKLRATQEAQRVKQKQMLNEMLRIEQEGARKLDLVEEQVKSAAVETRPTVYMLDSLAFTRSASRDQRLRYSGSVGDADVEVRGPGSVSVQGDGDDIVIVTSDAVIRIKNRKVRDRIE